MFDISELIEVMRTTAEALFQESMARPQIQWQKVATSVDSQHALYKANWLGSPPAMRPFKGRVDVAPVYPHDYTIEVLEHAVAVGVKLRTLRESGLVDFATVVRQMTDAATYYYDKLVFEQMSDGFTDLCFDGAAFYSASHSWGKSGTYDNLDTAVLSDTSLVTARKTIHTAKNDQGEPMGYVVSDITVHPNLWKTALDIVGVAILSGGGENVLKSLVNVIESPWLKTEDEWHVGANGGPTKPFLLVEQLPIQMDDDTQSGDSKFWNHAVHFQVQAEAAPGLGLPQQAYGSTGAGP